MQRIIVTGATSMIGVALIEECIKHGTEVYAVVREGSKKRSRLPESSLIKFGTVNCQNFFASGSDHAFFVVPKDSWIP